MNAHIMSVYIWWARPSVHTARSLTPLHSHYCVTLVVFVCGVRSLGCTPSVLARSSATEGFGGVSRVSARSSSRESSRTVPQTSVGTGIDSRCRDRENRCVHCSDVALPSTTPEKRKVLPLVVTRTAVRTTVVCTARCSYDSAITQPSRLCYHHPVTAHSVCPPGLARTRAVSHRVSRRQSCRRHPSYPEGR